MAARFMMGLAMKLTLAETAVARREAITMDCILMDFVSNE
jgi:hypothetical protein